MCPGQGWQSWWIGTERGWSPVQTPEARIARAETRVCVLGQACRLPGPLAPAHSPLGHGAFSQWAWWGAEQWWALG